MVEDRVLDGVLVDNFIFDGEMCSRPPFGVRRFDCSLEPREIGVDALELVPQSNPGLVRHASVMV